MNELLRALEALRAISGTGYVLERHDDKTVSVRHVDVSVPFTPLGEAISAIQKRTQQLMDQVTGKANEQ